jgi:hypothetical protein
LTGFLASFLAGICFLMAMVGGDSTLIGTLGGGLTRSLSSCKPARRAMRHVAFCTCRFHLFVAVSPSWDWLFEQQ